MQNKIIVFDKFSEEMLKFCRNDVNLTEKLYNFLCKKMTDFGEAIALEHKVAKIIQRQHQKGFLIDLST